MSLCMPAIQPGRIPPASMDHAGVAKAWGLCAALTGADDGGWMSVIMCCVAGTPGMLSLRFRMQPTLPAVATCESDARRYAERGMRTCGTAGKAQRNGAQPVQAAGLCATLLHKTVAFMASTVARLEQARICSAVGGDISVAKKCATAHFATYCSLMPPCTTLHYMLLLLKGG